MWDFLWYLKTTKYIFININKYLASKCGGEDGIRTVGMYDPLGPFVYFDSYGGFSDESEGKRH